MMDDAPGFSSDHIETFDPEFASPAQWAKMYRACGLQVVPGYMPGEPKNGSWKRPRLPEWKKLQKHLLTDSEFDDLYGPNGKYAGRAQMGILTGPCSGDLLVIDLDSYKNPAAAQWWSGVLAVHNNSMAPETASQRTGGGGRQLLFFAPPDWHAPTNRTGIGVDIRGAAGFIVAPPSLHDSGRHYEWEAGCAPWEIGIAEAPGWLLESIENLVKMHGGNSGGGGRERTASSAGDFDGFGKHKDGREEYMRNLIWAAVVDWRRQCPMPPSPAESAARMGETWVVYERNTRSRLPSEEGVSNAELLEREGRGHSLFAKKWRRAMSQWDTSVAEDAAKTKPGAFRASAGSDATGADAGNEQAADEDWDASEDDERVANEAPVAQTLPVIKVQPRISLLTTETQQMLIGAKVPFYQRGGELVRPIIRTVKAAHGRLTKTAQLKTINPVYMRDTMCRHAHWERFDRKRMEWIETMAPLNVAQTLLVRDGVWPFAEIVGVIACPTMRPDGSLLVKQGYDKATRLLLIEPPAMPPIPDQPTRDDALRALALLEDLACESPFENEASKSVALSGFITPVVRGAMTVVPMHVSSAPAAGTGKSFLWDMAAAISIGRRRIPVIAAGNVEETEKRLAGVLLTGQPLISIDNVNGELKGDFLCQAIEQQYLDLRPLGSSKIVRVEAGSTTIFATGNNITIAGDLCRRTITSRLDAELESPQLRQFKHDPIKKILDDRGKYIAACLTICRAYIVADRPGKLKRLASFEAWSDTVRSALVWLGKADPIDTMESTRGDDPERSQLSEVLQAWAKEYGVGVGSAVPLAVIVERAMKMQSTGGFDSVLEPVFPDLNAAVRAASGAVGNAKVDLRRFGLWCRANKGRIVDGLRLMNKPSKRGGAATWWVEEK